ncbi:MAG: hypothetical protein J6M31_06465 [Bacteroidales bacterium]|nr:hypothetical protein [Bacteroidales bacterium]
MSRMLTYPGFSVVFIQTFSVHHTKEFILPEDALREMDTPYEDWDPSREVYVEKADALKVPIAWMERDIENQIFVLPQDRRDPTKGNVRRYSLRGFDFTMPIVPAEDESIYEVTLKGHCNVEMNLFFGHTASITYRFLFDGHACEISRPVVTDHIIAFLSNWLSAEFWSKEEGGEKTAIDYETHFGVDAIWLSAEGDPLDSPQRIDNLGTGRSFDAVALRYKNFIYKHCSQFKEDIPLSERKKLERRWNSAPFTVDNDLHYAMVDIWENLQHIEADGTDLFDNNAKNRLTEAQIVEHIREEHKGELIGLLTLYPEEWRYRDPSAYDEVCGENIAIDTDDLVLAGSSLCLVLGTYGRRGAGEEGVNWVEHLKERAHYHVSWPEYLMILQMILAKKYVIDLASNTLVLSTLDVEKKSSEDLIGQNAALSMRLTRMVTQLDVVKYSKFPSHKVMFDRTTARLGLNEDYERLSALMDSVDSSLHNLSDYKSMRSEFLLNIILAIISVASTFELFFQNSEMPFLEYFGLKSSKLAAIVVAVVACVTIFALLLVVSNSLRSIWDRIKENIGR